MVVGEADESLGKSLALYSRLQDPRLCFQPVRNRILTRRLRPREPGLRLLPLASRGNRGLRYRRRVLDPVKAGSPTGDAMEVTFRRSQLLSMEGRKAECRRGSRST